MKRLAEFFQEESGQFSMTRLVIFALVGAYIGWGTSIVIETQQIPAMPIAIFALVATLYGINTTDIASIFKGEK